jgi:hypothetical protein
MRKELAHPPERGGQRIRVMAAIPSRMTMNIPMRMVMSANAAGKSTSPGIASGAERERKFLLFALLPVSLAT